MHSDSNDSHVVHLYLRMYQKDTWRAVTANACIIEPISRSPRIIHTDELHCAYLPAALQVLAVLGARAGFHYACNANGNDRKLLFAKMPPYQEKRESFY